MRSAGMLVALGAFALFAPTLSFGFWDDDPAVVVRRPQELSLVEVFTLPAESLRYRPMGVLARALLARIDPASAPVLYHLTNVSLHVISVVALFALVRAVTRSARLAALSAVLFGLHFYAYAVGYAGSLVYPLMTAFLLTALALHTASTLGSSVRHAPLAASLLLYGAALFTQDSALPLVLLFPLLHWVRTGRSPLGGKAIAWAPLVLLVVFRLGMLAFAYRRLPPQAGLGPGLPDPEGALYFLQAVLLPLPALLPSALPQATAALPVLAAAALLAAGVALAVRPHPLRRRLAVLAALWAALASAPAVFLLPERYPLGAPWLAYLVAPPSAILWALLLWGVWEGLQAAARARARFPVRAAGGLALAGWLSLNQTLLVRQLDVYRQASDLADRVIELSAGWGPESRLLLVNLPQFVPHSGTRLPVGFAGASLFPTYLEISRAVAVRLGSSPGMESISSAALMGPFFHTHGRAVGPAHLLAEALFADQVLLARLGEGGQVRILPLAEWSPGEAGPLAGEVARLREQAARSGGIYLASPWLAQREVSQSRASGLARYFHPGSGWAWPPQGEGLYLVTANEPSLRLPPGLRAARLAELELGGELSAQGLRLLSGPRPGAPRGAQAEFANGVRLLDWGRTEDALWLLWQASLPGEEELSVFVHLLSGGELAGQADGPPLGGSYPFHLWRPGELVLDLRPLPDRGSELLVGLYAPATGRRVPVSGASLTLLPGGDGVVLGER